MNLSSKGETIQKFLYFTVFLFLCYQAYFHLLASDFLNQPNLLFPKGHYIQKVIHETNIDKFVISNKYLLNAMDIMLFILVIFCFVFPNKLAMSILCLLSGIVYYFLYHIGIGHHDHVIIPFLLVLLILCFKNDIYFEIGFDLIRYYCCMIFVSAGFWKIFNGSFFDVNHLQNSIIFEYRHLCASLPNSNMLNLYLDLSSSIVSNILWYLACGLELFFFAGFLTKKFDLLLSMFLFLFVLFDHMILHIQFWPYLLFLPFFMKIEHLHYRVSNFGYYWRQLCPFEIVK